MRSHSRRGDVYKQHVAIKALSIAILSSFLCTLFASMSEGNDDVKSMLPRAPQASGSFNKGAAAKLSAEQRRAMDIEFFNEFWVKDEFPTRDRVQKIRSLGNAGFEVAYLADNLYDFARGGSPSFRPDYLVYWKRLKSLAESGDASAQCLFSHTAGEYGNFNFDPPTRIDKEVLAPKYRKAAADKGQFYCRALWASEAYKNDQATRRKLDLDCARHGVTICQNSMGVAYFNGLGVTGDPAKALCWFAKARLQNRAPSLENNFRVYTALLRERFGERIEQFANRLNGDTDCDKVTIQ